jgi:hypothetical protein
VEAIARLNAADRRALFEAVALHPGSALPRALPVEIIEKDAWVCFVLERLFRLPLLLGEGREPTIVFKGGTSLSKAFALIRRFSEDVDLTLDPALFGERLAPFDASRSQQEKQTKAARAGCDDFVSGPLREALDADVSSVLGARDWVLPTDDRSKLSFAYPRVGTGGGYLVPTVQLEFGARSEREPWSLRPVVAYAAQARPNAGLGAAFEIPVLAAERTFWEKATLLHAENALARTPPDRHPPWTRFSRHASDLAAMADTEIVQNAIADESLLRRVCDCKQGRFRENYVDYRDVHRANIEIVPRGALAGALASDYVGMQSMFFEDPPPWDDVIDRLGALEARIHRA